MWGPADPSAVAILEDHRGRALGWGLYSPESDICVRLAGVFFDGGGDKKRGPQVNAALAPDASWLERRLERALAARGSLGLSEQPTTGYRELNSEGDGVPGLVIDRYGDDRVVQITTAPIAARAPQILEWLRARTRGRVIVTSPARAAEREGFKPLSRVLRGAAAGPPGEDVSRDMSERDAAPLEFLEHGLRLAVPPPPGQKTGGYHDQRENRAEVAALAAARGLPLLDIGCHVGGFALHAARRGVTAVGIDQSALALRCAADNAARNKLSDKTSFIEGDMFAPKTWLPALTASDGSGAGGQGFGVIVLDPPAMARRKRDVERARAALQRTIATLAPHVAARGFLVVCSCSHHLSREQLDVALLTATCGRGGDWTRTRALGAGPDHPVMPGHREGEYLRVNVYQRR